MSLIDIETTDRQVNPVDLVEDLAAERVDLRQVRR